MSALTHFSLFSGIGGSTLRRKPQGLHLCQCEWAISDGSFEKHWPQVPKFKDITTVTKEAFLKKQDEKPPRLFPGIPLPALFQRRKQRDLRTNGIYGPKCSALFGNSPLLVLGENVAGFIHLGLDKTVFDLSRQATPLGFSYFLLSPSAWHEAKNFHHRPLLPTPLPATRGMWGNCRWDDPDRGFENTTPAEPYGRRGCHGRFTNCWAARRGM